MKWHDAKETLPGKCTEVLVWIDDARGPSWRNNHAIVAYCNPIGEWYTQIGREEKEVKHEVLAWAYFEEPETGLFV